MGTDNLDIFNCVEVTAKTIQFLEASMGGILFATFSACYHATMAADDFNRLAISGWENGEVFPARYLFL